jgi:hypothetical protein
VNKTNTNAAGTLYPIMYSYQGAGSSQYDWFRIRKYLSNPPSVSNGTETKSTTLTFGGTSAANTWVNSSTITATTPAHADGNVNVVITNSDNQTATASSSFYYYPPTATVPGAPTINSATASSGQVVLNWTAPSNTGNISLTSYTIRYGTTTDVNCSLTTAGSAGCTEITGISPSTTSNTITNLTNGVTYQFTVFAVNAVGAGSAATQATASPGSVPSTPTSLAAHAENNGDVTLTWNVPSNNGGFSIDDYFLQYKKTTDSIFTTSDLTGTYSVNQNLGIVTAIIHGLTVRQSYLFQVAAHNSVGNSSYSSQANATPITIGDECGSVETLDSTVGQAHSVDLTTVGYGSDYLVGFSSQAGHPDRIEKITVPAHSVLNIGLTAASFDVVNRVAIADSCTNGTQAGSNVSSPDYLSPAMNSNGYHHTDLQNFTYINNGNASKDIYWATTGYVNNASGTYTLAYTITQPPLNFTVNTPATWNSTGNNSIVLNWNAAGGTTSNYVVEYRPYPFTDSYTTFATVSSNTLTSTITGLQDQTYQFRVTALQANQAQYSTDPITYNPGESCNNPDTLIDSPAGSVHTFSGTTVGYNSDMLTTGNSQNYLSLIGSAKDHIHQVTVPPYNILNISSSYYSGKITRIAVGDTCTNNSPAGTSIASPDTLSPAQNSGVWDDSNSTTFHYFNSSATAKNIYWVNSSHVGYVPHDYTLTWSINPPTVPGAPTGLSATTASGQAHLTWTAPANNGGAPVSYVVHYSQDDFINEITANVSGTSTTITGLTNGTTYKFKVLAHNQAGDSTYSNAVSATPQNLPPTISSISPNGGKSSGGDTVTITGTNFLNGATITIGGNTPNVNFIDNNHLSFSSPAHAAGTVSVTVTNPDNQFITSNNFYSYYDAPTVSSVSPAYATTAGNSSITITGTNFRSGVGVTIGGVSGSTSSVTSTSISVAVPAGLPLGDQLITITNPSPDQQQVSLPSDAFTIYPSGPIEVINPPGITNSKFNLSAGQTQDIAFNKPLTSASKTAVEEAISASDGQSISYTWNSRNTVVTVQAGSTAASVFDNNVYAISLTDVFNTTTNNILLIKSVPKVYQSEISSTLSLESGITEAVVNQSIPATITIPQTTASPTINVKPLIYNNEIATLPNLQIDRTSDAGIVHVSIPSGTNVTAANSAIWDGTMDITHVLVSNDVQTYIPTPPGGLVANVSGYRMGKSDNTLLFQKAVRLQFEGMSSKSVGYIENGNFHEITLTCPADDQTSANNVLAYPLLDQNGNITSHSDCKIAVGTNGNDWAVWTKHFTDFVFYDEVNPPTVTSVSPNTGAIAGGNTVTITGTNFGTGATVEFGSGNFSSSVTVDSNTQITATVPTGSGRGSVTVTVTRANGYTYADVPGNVTISSATAGDTQVNLSWTVPTDNGGSAITGYTIRYSENLPSCDLSITVGSSACYSELQSASTSAIVSGLNNGTDYQFAVFANNAVGSSIISTNILTSSPAASENPGTPTASTVSLTVGDSQITVNWTLPDNGGSPITGYTIRYGKNSDGCNPASEITTGCTDIVISSTDPEFTSRSKSITGLSNGSAYNIGVITTNTIGSTHSASVQGTPTTGNSGNCGASGNDVCGTQVISCPAPSAYINSTPANFNFTDTIVSSANQSSTAHLPLYFYTCNSGSPISAKVYATSNFLRTTDSRSIDITNLSIASVQDLVCKTTCFGSMVKELLAPTAFSGLGSSYAINLYSIPTDTNGEFSSADTNTVDFSLNIPASTPAGTYVANFTFEIS